MSTSPPPLHTSLHLPLSLPPPFTPPFTSHYLYLPPPPIHTYLHHSQSLPPPPPPPHFSTFFDDSCFSWEVLSFSLSVLVAGIVYCFSWEVLSFSFCLLQALSTVFHGKFCHSLSACCRHCLLFFMGSSVILSLCACCRHCLLFFMGSSVILFLLVAGIVYCFSWEVLSFSLSVLAAGIVYCFSWEVLSFSFCLLQALSTVFHGKFCHSLSACCRHCLLFFMGSSVILFLLVAGIVYCFSWEVLSFSFCLLQALSTVFHGKFCHSLSACCRHCLLFFMGSSVILFLLVAGIVYCFSWEVLSFSFCLLQALSTVFPRKNQQKWPEDFKSKGSSRCVTMPTWLPRNAAACIDCGLLIRFRSARIVEHFQGSC